MISEWGLKNCPEGYPFPDMWVFKKTALSTVVCLCASRLVDFIFYDHCYAHAKTKTDHATCHRYAKKGTRYIYQSIYFTVATVWGWYVLKDTTWLPWYLGGLNNGDLLTTARQFSRESPYMVYDKAIIDYSLYTMGYHVGGFIEHVRDERHTDFAEMFLHHTATVTLYFGFITANCMTPGAVITYLHDIADITSSLTKFCECQGHSFATMFFFFTNMGLWAFTRLTCLPILIYTIYYYYNFGENGDDERAAF